MLARISLSLLAHAALGCNFKSGSIVFRAKFHVFRGEHGTIEGRLIMQANLSAGQDRDLSSRIMGRVRLLGCARHNLQAKRLHATMRGICPPLSIRIVRNVFQLRYKL